MVEYSFGRIVGFDEMVFTYHEDNQMREEKMVPDEGQEVSIQGFRFTAHNIRIIKDDNGRDTLRFNGKAVDTDLQGTGYDGGVYGHIIGYRTY